MSSLQTPPLSPRQATPEPAGLRLARILLPIVVLAAGVAAWELVVRLKHLPPYLLPGPVAVLRTLIVDWQVLFQSLHTISVQAASIGIGSLILLILIRRFIPRVPGAIIVVVISAILVSTLHLAADPNTLGDDAA